MNIQKCVGQAEKMACKAGPGHMTLNGNLYTFEFDQNLWLYNVYVNGFLFCSYNTKSLKTAKQWLKEYFES